MSDKPPRDYYTRGLLAEFDFRTNNRSGRASNLSDPESLRRAYSFFDTYGTMESRDLVSSRTGNQLAGDQVIISHDFATFPEWSMSGRGKTLPFNDPKFDVYLKYMGQQVRVSSEQQVSASLRSLVGDIAGYANLTKFFSGCGLQSHLLEFTVFVTKDNSRSNFNITPFRAHANDVRSRFYGVMNKTSNCVMKAIYHRTAYYYEDNTTKRPSMWNGDVKKGLTKHEPGYDAAAVKALKDDPTFRRVRTGYESFLREFDYSPINHPGFDIRDLIRLADYIEAGICIWTIVGGRPWCRLDTRNYQYHSARRMRVYHFYMSNTQHLELMESQSSEDLRMEFNRLTKLDGAVYRDFVDTKKHKTVYLDDAGMEGLVSGKTKHLHTMSILREKKLPVSEQRAAVERGELYRDYILMDGNNIYKHVSVKELLQGLAETDTDEYVYYSKHPGDYLYVTNIKDIDYVKLKRVYKERNFMGLKQQEDPRLYMAATLSDSTVGHVLYGDTLTTDDDIYSYDGHKWYATEMNEFPYFHGYPLRSNWHEYDGVKATVDLQNFSVPKRNFIGNAPGDTPFTFGYGKYAIFQMESIDLSACSDNARAHFQRDKIFGPVTEGCVQFLTSPIVHFLQEQGAVWRANRVWVCYAVSPHWCPDVGLWEDIKENKSYQPIIGKFMSGSNNIEERTYIAPDLETAKELTFWYSQRFLTQLENTECPDLEAGKRVLRRDIDPSTIMGDYDMVLRCAGSYLTRGGDYTALQTKTEALPDDYEFPDTDTSVQGNAVRVVPEEDSPYRVRVVEDMNGFNTGYQHISGAIHAYCFIRLYSAILQIPASEVVGVSVDCIKTKSDCREYLGEMYSEEFKNGCFKSEPVFKYSHPVYLTRLLSGHEYPAHYLEGIYSKSLVSVPKWNAYKDGLAQFNIVTGPAGSGKTTRHFMDFGSDDIEKDYRLDTSKVVYMTLTNYLSIEMGKKLGVRAYTSYKGMNRTVGDGGHFVDPSDRYNKCLNWSQMVDLNKMKGKHTVFLDEVTMQEPDKVLDMIRVCYAYGLQLFVTGDVSKDGTLYQLGPINGGAAGLFNALQKAKLELDIEYNWIKPMGLFRQATDKELGVLLGTIRAIPVDYGNVFMNPYNGRPWTMLETSPLFEHIDLDEMLKRFVIGKDMAVNPVHKYLSFVTYRLFKERVDGDTQIPMRCNLDKPERVSSASEFMKGFVPLLDDGSMDPAYETISKGMTRLVYSSELASVKDKLMTHGFPYDKRNDINPMMAVTVHNLQGLTISDDSVLYVCYSDGGALEWGVDRGDPRLVYVAASRVRHRQQLVLVKLPNIEPFKDYQRRPKRQRPWGMVRVP